MARVLKFPLSEKIFHNVNLVTWMILIITGAIVYFDLATRETMELMMDIHIGIAIIFTINFLGFVFLAMDRFLLMLRNLFIFDKDTFLWFKNLGGYPRRFGIKFGPEETAPQGRFNAGQKPAYIIFIFSIFALIVTGWLLYLFVPVLGKTPIVYMFNFHVWGSIIVTALVIFVHAPMALLNMSDFKAMFSPFDGTVSIEDAKHHSPKWVENDIAKLERM